MSENPKEMIFHEKARKFLQKGISKVEETSSPTLGIKGRTVGLESSFGSPKITNDGASIVKEIELENTYENMGVELAKEVVQKMKENCGDGSTTSILLLNALVKEGVKQIAAGSSPIGVKRGIDKACAAVVSYIEEKAISIDESQIESLAKASASGSEEVGQTLKAAYEKVGRTGVIQIEESKTTQTHVHIVEGMRFDRGYMSPYFCTNQEKMVCELENPYILVVEKKVQNVHELLPVLQSVAASGKQLLIIADDLEGDTLSTLVVNRLRGSLKVCAVKAPGFGDKKKSMLEDLACLTGATLASDETGEILKEFNDTKLGRAQKVLITKDHTTIVQGSGDAQKIQGRIEQIDQELEKASNSYDKEKLVQRKANLTGSIAQVEVGAATESEMKTKKQMFEDSLNSTKAALEEGVVVGGGVSLLNASSVVDALSLTGDEKIGATIFKKALTAPFLQIVANSGFDGAVLLCQVQEKNAPGFGFNAYTDRVENLLEAKIFDPAKVVKNALTSSASTAGIVLITEVLIADEVEESAQAS